MPVDNLTDIYFQTSVGNELLNENPNIFQEFKEIVIDVLSDDLGWKQYGYNFIYSDIDDKKNMLKINLRSAKETDKICRGLDGLSCTRFRGKYEPIDITIHYGNWNGGSKSTLSVDDYRRYVINHEVGHWLGLDHTECPIEKCKELGYTKCPASIMQQMSKGPDHVSPCDESCRPRPPEWVIDDPNKSPYRFIKKEKLGGGRNKNVVLLMVLLMVLLIILLIVINIICRKYNLPCKYKYNLLPQ